MKSIKDKNNLVPYDTWSGGEYSNTHDVVISNGTLEISVEWSINGDKSFKIIKNSDNAGFFRASNYIEYTTENTTLTVEFDYKLLSASFHASFVQYDQNKTELSRTQLGCSASEHNHPSLSLTTNTNVKYLAFVINLYGSTGTILYLDNITLHS